MILLNSICDVFNGYSFRDKLTVNELDGIGIIQLKDTDTKTVVVNYNDWTTTDTFFGPDKYFLSQNDILLVAKGANNVAFRYEADKCKFNKAIVSGAFIVIRPKSDDLHPAYLHWYMNLPETQAYLRNQQVKTTVQNLSVKVLQEFEIKVPSLQKQRDIGDGYSLILQLVSTSRQREDKLLLLLNQQIKEIL